MFTKAKNIETAFRHVRTFTMLLIAAMTAFTLFISYHCFTSLDAMQQKVYVLINGKAFEVQASDREGNIPVEGRDHVTVFHELFFNLDPDEKVIQGNLARALYLADGTARRVYSDLKEQGYYSGIISANISQRLRVDSVSVDASVHPYRFRCYATQLITRTTSTITRNLITEGQLRNVNRSDHNPHGFLVEKWNTIENRDLKSEAR